MNAKSQHRVHLGIANDVSEKYEAMLKGFAWLLNGGTNLAGQLQKSAVPTESRLNK